MECRTMPHPWFQSTIENGTWILDHCYFQRESDCKVKMLERIILCQDDLVSCAFVNAKFVWIYSNMFQISVRCDALAWVHGRIVQTFPHSEALLHSSGFGVLSDSSLKRPFAVLQPSFAERGLNWYHIPSTQPPCQAPPLPCRCMLMGPRKVQMAELAPAEAPSQQLRNLS